MKKYQNIICILLVIIMVFLCACDKKEVKTNWAYYMIGYDSNTPKASSEISIGIIDVEQPIISDEGNDVGLSHMDISKKIIRDIVSNVNFVEEVLVEDTPEYLAVCIDRLVEKDVRIINIALGTNTDNEILKESVKRANESGILLICAAGNNYGNLLYPALYDDTVSCLARNIHHEDMYKNTDKISKKSFSAPGYHVPIGEEVYSGTSISCAFLSATCALGILNNPGIDNTSLLELLKSSCYAPNDSSYGVVKIDELMR